MGLIITGIAYVSQDGQFGFPCETRIISDEYMSKYREFVEVTLQYGAKIAMQIGHAGRQTTAEMIVTQPLALSAVEDLEWVTLQG